MLPSLITPAYAQDAAGMMSSATQFLPLVLIFVVFYFLLIRPQQQQQKDLKRQIAALKRNDQVVTAGGILARVVKVTDGVSEIEVEIAPNIRVTVVRETIASVVKPKAANDAKVKAG